MCLLFAEDTLEPSMFNRLSLAQPLERAMYGDDYWTTVPFLAPLIRIKLPVSTIVPWLVLDGLILSIEARGVKSADYYSDKLMNLSYSGPVPVFFLSALARSMGPTAEAPREDESLMRLIGINWSLAAAPLIASMSCWQSIFGVSYSITCGKLWSAYVTLVLFLSGSSLS